MNSDITLIVVSWDGAEELWKPFSDNMKLFWNDCPFDIILLTQTKKAPENSVFTKTINIPSDKTKPEPVYRINKALKEITTPYVFLICDDYFFNKRMSAETIYLLIQQMEKENIDIIKVNNFIFSKQRILLQKYTSYFIISTGIPCIYTKKSLEEITESCKGLSLRSFEVSGSNYVRLHKDTIKVANAFGYPISTIHCVLENYWRWQAFNFCKRNRLLLSFFTYKKPSLRRTIYTFFKSTIFHFVLFFMPHIYAKYSLKKYQYIE